jgi:hypothetical protein
VRCIWEDGVISGGVDCFLALRVNPGFLDCDDVVLFRVELLYERGLDLVITVVNVVLYDCEVAGVAIHRTRLVYLL